jgi:hypothetical protein
MPCCGQNRENLQANQRVAALPFPATIPAPVTGRPAVNGAPATSLRYRNAGHVLVRGPKTGWSYEFSKAKPVQAVEARDAQLLIATGLFEVAG